MYIHTIQQTYSMARKNLIQREEKRQKLRYDYLRFELIYLINSNNKILRIISMELRKKKLTTTTFSLYMQ
jgi:hypothetical protein